MIIACDLDGTLAHFDEWKGLDFIGKPIPRMVMLVQDALRHGHTVRIFTARVDEHGNQEPAIAPIRKWLKEVGLPTDMVITNIKGWDVDQFWDDRARQVITNRGIFLEEDLENG